jgi:hypothetical protein
MPEAGFEPSDYNTKWQRPTIRLSPGKVIWKVTAILALKRKPLEIKQNFDLHVTTIASFYFST